MNVQSVQQTGCPSKLKCPNSVRGFPFERVGELFNVASTAVTKPVACYAFWSGDLV